MLLKQIAQDLNLKPVNNTEAEIEVTGGYASDLLSDVLANAKNGTLWITNQKHQNIIGVAVMLNLSGVIISGGIDPDPNTVEKALEENVPLFTTDMSTFELVGNLYGMGIRGC